MSAERRGLSYLFEKMRGKATPSASQPSDTVTKVPITVTDTEQPETPVEPEAPQAENPTDESDEATRESSPPSQPPDNTESEGEQASDGQVEELDPIQAELSALREERDKLRDQLLRTTADFENYRRRSRREAEEAKMRGKDDAVKELLPVFDNLERAVQASGNATEVASVVDGVNMVLKMFEDTAQRMGLNRVPGVGNRFDPAVHEAIQQVETEEHSPGIIIGEVAAGYMFGKRLLRAAMVVVAKPPAKATAPSDAPIAMVEHDDQDEPADGEPS